MNDISMLEELGLQEVSRKTHIEIKYLQWMLERKFDKLNRINTLGFIKILSREYRLDLSEWVEEFEAYWAENRQESAPVERMYISSQRSSRRWPWVLILLLLGIVGAGWYFDAPKYLDLSLTEKNEQNVSHLYTTTPVVEEARVNLEMMVLEENATTVPENTLLIPEDKEEVVVDENVSEVVHPEVETQEAISPQMNQATEVAEETSTQVAHLIKPGIKIWVGIVYLDNMKRTSYLTQEDIVFDMTREQIVTTGHGRFDLVKGEQTESFATEFPKRFHIKDNVITPISYQEFITLNKGKPW